MVAAGVNLLEHWLTFGASELRNPNTLIDMTSYTSGDAGAAAALAAGDINALIDEFKTDIAEPIAQQIAAGGTAETVISTVAAAASSGSGSSSGTTTGTTTVATGGGGGGGLQGSTLKVIAASFNATTGIGVENGISTSPLGDTIEVTNSAHFGGTVTIDGGAGTDTLSVNASGSADISADTFQNVEQVSLRGGFTLTASASQLSGVTLDATGTNSVTVTNVETSMDGSTTITGSGSTSDIYLVTESGGNGIALTDAGFANITAVETLKIGTGASTSSFVFGSNADTWADSNDSDVLFLDVNGEDTATITVTAATGFDEDLTVTDSAGGSEVKVTLADGANSRILVGDGMTSSITGGTGNDTIIGEDGADTLNGGDGTDSLVGGAGADTLNGGNGNDTISAGTGNDSINGGADNDLIIIVESSLDGSDVTIDGGAGTDTLRISETGAAGMTIADAALDRITAVETLQIDTITGNAAFTFGSNADTWADANGSDILNFDLNGQDTAVGVITITAENASFDEDLTLIDSTDTTVSATLAGSTGTRVLVGSGEVASITGGSGADSIVGHSGADTISGGAGNDSFTTGGGADSLTGGAGNDTVIMTITEGSSSAASSAATITDFGTSGTDVFDLSNVTLTDLRGTGADYQEGDASTTSTLTLGTNTGFFLATNAASSLSEADIYTALGDIADEIVANDILYVAISDGTDSVIARITDVASAGSLVDSADTLEYVLNLTGVDATELAALATANFADFT